MKIRQVLFAAVAGVLLVVGAMVFEGSARGSGVASEMYLDPSGILRTTTTAGSFDGTNAFFQSLGTNGRACASCHAASDAWGLSAEHARERFKMSEGKDPIFRPVDGATCPTADVSTEAARRQAYANLLNKGLFRIQLPIPANADYTIEVVDEGTGGCAMYDGQVAVFRRPLPATNLPFLTTVMWDGRESPKGRSLEDNLISQALDATLGHAQAATAPSDATLQAIADFEKATFTAQQVDRSAGNLASAGALGGSEQLSTQDFFPGINDSLGLNPTGAAFTPVVFSLFDKWMGWDAPNDRDERRSDARHAIARGEQVFNSMQFTISGVPGLNGSPSDPLGTTPLKGTCGSCHDSPNVGAHSLPLAVDVGVSDASRRTPDLPLYKVTCTEVNPDGSHTVKYTSDPGRGLITGKCSDIGKLKGPVLRGLAARAPYFQNGSAATLLDVVNFYDQRFQIHMTDQQKSDLVAFLRSL